MARNRGELGQAIRAARLKRQSDAKSADDGTNAGARDEAVDASSATSGGPGTKGDRSQQRGGGEQMSQ